MWFLEKLLLQVNHGGNMKKLKVKITQLCLTLCDPMDAWSPWNSSGQNTGVGSLSLLQGIFPTQGSNPGLPHCRQILCQLSHKGSPRIFEWVAYSSSSISFQPRNWTRVPCGFLTNWAVREALIIAVITGESWWEYECHTIRTDRGKKLKIWLCERNTTLRCRSLNPQCSVQQNTLWLSISMYTRCSDSMFQLDLCLCSCFRLGSIEAVLERGIWSLWFIEKACR